MKLKLKNKGGEYGELSERSTRKKCVYVFLDFRVVIIKKGEIVEASFMIESRLIHDDESRLIQGVLMITKMMTKSSRE